EHLPNVRGLMLLLLLSILEGAQHAHLLSVVGPVSIFPAAGPASRSDGLMSYVAGVIRQQLDEHCLRSPPLPPMLNSVHLGQRVAKNKPAEGRGLWRKVLTMEAIRV